MKEDKTAFQILDEYFDGGYHVHSSAWQTLKEELAQQHLTSPKLPPYNKESFIKYLGDNNMGFADTSLSCAKHYHEFLRRQLQA